jgi:hypothetical protein
VIVAPRSRSQPTSRECVRAVTVQQDHAARTRLELAHAEAQAVLRARPAVLLGGHVHPVQLWIAGLPEPRVLDRDPLGEQARGVGRDLLALEHYAPAVDRGHEVDLARLRGHVAHVGAHLDLGGAAQLRQARQHLHVRDVDGVDAAHVHLAQ